VALSFTQAVKKHLRLPPRITRRLRPVRGRDGFIFNHIKASGFPREFSFSSYPVCLRQNDIERFRLRLYPSAAGRSGNFSRGGSYKLKSNVSRTPFKFRH
jgi:hypothetical protein